MTDVQIRLTDLASCGGCAAKYSAARLEELLRGFVPVEAERLLVGLAPADDAAVYLLDDDRALVFTVDFFPPIVDDAGDYGAIAATNALNDVFAMGGTPLLALSIAAFPEELPSDVLARVFAAAAAQVQAAGGLLAGGHTIRDEEPKYGLAVVGTVHPRGIWSKAGARAGDALFLTKPLGTGLIVTGYKKRLTGTQQLERAIEWMRTLNAEAAETFACSRSARRHRRHRLRAVRPRVRGRIAQRRPDRARRRPPARDRRRARPRPQGCPDERRPP
jgi:selenide, water dikinase